MKSFSLLPRILAGAVALAATGTWALTVGRVQGVAWIGRPLEVSVPVTLDAGEDAAAQCAQAEVFYGDIRIDPSRVATDTQPAASGLRIRLRSTAVVNEPVVTVYLHLGCTGKVTRRFVLLAEHPESSQAEPARAPTLATPRPPVQSAAAAPPAPGGRPGPAAPSAAATARESGASRSNRARASDGQPAPAPRPQTARAAARLKLEPLDLSEDRDPSLRLSSELPPSQEASAEQRARAAALWRALNARPEDVLREAQRIETLEKDLAALRQSMQRNEAAIAGLRTELEAARTARYANPVVFGLLALLLAGAGAALYAWRRGRWHATRGADWWRSRDGQDSDLLSIPPAAPLRRPAPVAPDSGPPSEPADLDLSFTESALQRLHQEPASRPHTDFQFSSRQDDFQPASMRAVRAEELHDVQQEADFFLSLGDHDRAIEVLRNHISMNPGTSAVAWLDLLEIHHKLGRREEYESVRQEFLRNFDVQVPAFDAYREDQAGLESYGNAMLRITALWPSRKVLDLIEESIFRKPGQHGAEAFNLEAYRDLLLLHHIGRDVLQGARFADSDGPAGSGFSNTAIHPLSARAMMELEPPPELSFPMLGQEVGMSLDLNLDEPGPATAEPPIGEAQPLPSLHGNLLDFDLPDAPTTNLRSKATRE